MLGTKCPSITSRWIQSAPAASTARTSSPSLAKSAARIDGAMTRGRDANCWDMCAFPNLFKGADGPRVTWGRAGGNAAALALLQAEKSAAAGSYCRVGLIGRRRRKARFCWVFSIGTALADQHARIVGRQRVRPCWSPVMFFALGAASSAIDALKALTSSKSSAQTAGVGQNASKPVRTVILERFGFDRRGSRLGRQRLVVDIAANHERAA